MRTLALNLLRCIGFRPIRAGLMAVAHNTSRLHGWVRVSSAAKGWDDFQPPLGAGAVQEVATWQTTFVSTVRMNAVAFPSIALIRAIQGRIGCAGHALIAKHLNTCTPQRYDAKISKQPRSVMRTTFHIGMPKTGTTTLQRTFTANASLLKNSKVLYPTMLSSSSMNHRILACLIREPRHYPRHMRHFRSDHVSRTLINEINTTIEMQRQESSFDYLVLSAESLFYPIHKNKHQAFRSFVLSFDPDPLFIAYLRSPSSFYLAVCQQKLRASTQLKSLSPPRYREVLESYQLTFPTSSISVSLFERKALLSQDIVVDFCSKYLSDAEINPSQFQMKSDSNISLSPEAMAVCRLYRLAFWANNDDEATPGSKKMINTLRRADLHCGHKKALLKPEISEILENHAASDLLWLRDAYGLTFSDVTYGSLASKKSLSGIANITCKPRTLKEIVHIDLCRLVGIIDYLRESPFADDKPEVASWLADLRLDDLRQI
jgi:hypothetical protein